MSQSLDKTRRRMQEQHERVVRAEHDFAALRDQVFALRSTVDEVSALRDRLELLVTRNQTLTTEDQELARNLTALSTQVDILLEQRATLRKYESHTLFFHNSFFFFFFFFLKLFNSIYDSSSNTYIIVKKILFLKFQFLAESLKSEKKISNQSEIDFKIKL